MAYRLIKTLIQANKGILQPISTTIECLRMVTVESSHSLPYCHTFLSPSCFLICSAGCHHNPFHSNLFKYMMREIPNTHLSGPSHARIFSSKFPCIQRGFLPVMCTFFVHSNLMCRRSPWDLILYPAKKSGRSLMCITSVHKTNKCMAVKSEITPFPHIWIVANIS